MRIRKRLWVRYAAVPLVLALAVATCFGYAWRVMLRVPVAPHFAPPRDRAEAQRQDLQYLMRSMHALDRSFSADAWKKLDRQLDILTTKAGRLSDAEFELGIAKAVAFANNSHTNADGVSRGVTLNSIPLRLDWFKEGLFVVAAAPSQSELLGGRVLVEGGHSPAEIVAALVSYVGGNEAHRRAIAPYFMESPAALNAMGMIPAAGNVSLTVELPGGHIEHRDILAQDGPENGPRHRSHLLEAFRENHDTMRDLSPVRAPEDEREWVRVLGSGHETPLTFGNPYKFHWDTYLAKGGVLFVQLNVCLSEPGKPSLAAYLAQVVRDARVRSLAMRS